MEQEKNTTEETMQEHSAEAIFSGPFPMGKDLAEFLYELGKNDRNYTVKEINGASYVNLPSGCLTRIKPVDEKAAPDCMEIRTLSGLVDFLHSGADAESLFNEYERLYVCVEKVDTVIVYTPLCGVDNSRKSIARCAVRIPDITFDRYMPPEDFVIMLQTRFLEGENRDGVIALAGNLKAEESAQTTDDGMSQRIAVKQGVASVGEAVVKNPVYLAPRRTYDEVEQPSSPFILRFKQDGAAAGVALFEADGGAWKIAAIRAIGDWLKDKLSDMPVIVIA